MSEKLDGNQEKPNVQKENHSGNSPDLLEKSKPKKYTPPKRRGLTSQDILDRQVENLKRVRRRSRPEDLLLTPPLEVDRVLLDSTLTILKDGKEEIVKAADRPEHLPCGGWGVDYYTEAGDGGFAKWSDENQRWEDTPY